MHRKPSFKYKICTWTYTITRLGRSGQNEIKAVSGIALPRCIFCCVLDIPQRSLKCVSMFDETCVRQHEMSNGNNKRHQLLSSKISHSLLKLQGLCCRRRGTHWGVVDPGGASWIFLKSCKLAKVKRIISHSKCEDKYQNQRLKIPTRIMSIYFDTCDHMALQIYPGAWRAWPHLSVFWICRISFLAMYTLGAKRDV